MHMKTIKISDKGYKSLKKAKELLIQKGTKNLGLKLNPENISLASTAEMGALLIIEKLSK